MNEALVEMFRYNKWANLTLIDGCRTLADEHLDARVPGMSGSVRELLLHIVGSQQTFVLRTRGRQHEGEPDRSSPWPGFDRLLEIAVSSSDALIAIAADLDGKSEVDLPFMGKVYRHPIRFFLAHAIEHGVEHRTEIKLSLAQQGVETPDLDGWSYNNAAGYGHEVERSG